MNGLLSKCKKTNKLLQKAFYYFGTGMKTKEVSELMNKSYARVNNWYRKYRINNGIKSYREKNIISGQAKDETIEGLCRKWAYRLTKSYVETYLAARKYFSYIWLAKTIWLLEEYNRGKNEY